MGLALDLCYRKEPFTSERQRVEYLFALYEKLTAPLLPVAKKRRSPPSENFQVSLLTIDTGGLWQE